MTRSTLLFLASLALPFTAISQDTATEPTPPAAEVVEGVPVPPTPEKPAPEKPAPEPTTPEAAPPAVEPPAPVSPAALPPVPAHERGARPRGKGDRAEGKSDQVTSEKVKENERTEGKGKGMRPPQPPEPAKENNRAEAESRAKGKGKAGERPVTAPADPTAPRMNRPNAVVQKPAPKPEPKSAANATPNRPTAENKPAPGNNAARKDNVRPVRPPRPTAQRAPSQETTRALADRGKRDRRADAQQAAKIEDKDDAKKLIYTILGGAAAGAIVAKVATKDRPAGSPPQGYRPSVEEVGRTQMDRDRNVGGIVQRFQGNAPVATSPPGYAPVGVYRDDRGYEVRQDRRAPQFYDGNRRVVRYASANEVPPVIMASRQLNRVEMMPAARSPYAYAPTPQDSRDNRYYNEVPASYSGANAYAVSYQVDPNSAVSRDDILFRQGSTDFADAYSYDLVIDLAEAMNAPSLRNETFVIEGHASSEGDYGRNLLLSQERAERIARDLVYYGVDPERLMPVGYGEAEAAYPAEAPDEFRSLDRRVVVFRMR